MKKLLNAIHFYLYNTIIKIYLFQDFLLLEEFSETRAVNFDGPMTNGTFDGKVEHSKNHGLNGILAKNVHAKWNQEDDNDSIRNISFEIKQGQCFGICGSVGDGKVNSLSLSIFHHNETT